MDDVTAAVAVIEATRDHLEPLLAAASSPLAESLPINQCAEVVDGFDGLLSALQGLSLALEVAP